MSMPKIGPHKMVHDDHTVLHPPTTLRDKALSKVRQTPKEFDEAMTRADLALEPLPPRFPEWMRSEPKPLTDTFPRSHASSRNKQARRAGFRVAPDSPGRTKR